jgi:hypothetical protein
MEITGDKANPRNLCNLNSGWLDQGCLIFELDAYYILACTQVRLGVEVRHVLIWTFRTEMKY